MISQNRQWNHWVKLAWAKGSRQNHWLSIWGRLYKVRPVSYDVVSHRMVFSHVGDSRRTDQTMGHAPEDGLREGQCQAEGRA